MTKSDKSNSVLGIICFRPLLQVIQTPRDLVQTDNRLPPPFCKELIRVIRVIHSYPIVFLGSILIFCDVVSPYPHIPLQPTRLRMEKYLKEAFPLPSFISDFKSLLKTVYPQVYVSSITPITNFLLT